MHIWHNALSDLFLYDLFLGKLSGALVLLAALAYMGLIIFKTNSGSEQGRLNNGELLLLIFILYGNARFYIGYPVKEDAVMYIHMLAGIKVRHALEDQLHHLVDSFLLCFETAHVNKIRYWR